LRAAFDTVDREVLGRGVREGLVRRREDMLRETRSRVRVEEGLSEVFWTRRGMRQGCLLNPGLFNLLTADLKEYMKRWRGWGGMKLKEEKVYTLAYGDDMVLLAEEEDGRAMMSRLEGYMREKRLVVNAKKSKL